MLNLFGLLSSIVVPTRAFAPGMVVQSPEPVPERRLTRRSALRTLGLTYDLSIPVRLPNDETVYLDFHYSARRRTTDLSITSEHGTPFARGGSRRNRIDPFDPNIGERLALARALDTSAFDREDRTAIWRAYFAFTAEL